MSSVLEELSAVQREELLKVARQEIEPSIRSEIESANKVAMAKLFDEMRQNNDVKIQQAISDWRKKQQEDAKPLTTEQIQTMLSKEYVTFKVKLWYEDVEKEFVIRELPQSCEIRLLLKIKKLLSEGIQKLGGASFKLAEGDILVKLNALMELFEPSLNVLSECVVICLDPKGKYEWLTSEWVSANLTNDRILSILQAQVEVNRLRDFFFRLFQSFRSGAIENPVDSLLSQG